MKKVGEMENSDEIENRGNKWFQIFKSFKTKASIIILSNQTNVTGIIVNNL